MSGPGVLAILSAIGGYALALTVAVRGGHSIARWAFVGGMAQLATECVFNGLTANAILSAEMVDWQRWRLIATSFLPGVWLLFSLSYSRGNAREFLTGSRLLLAAAFLLPVGLAISCSERLIVSIDLIGPDHWLLRLGAPGLALHFLLLVSYVLILMNLERTFRSAVGTMRWRIKFMILGLGLLFAVRAYTSSQALLFRGLDLSLQSVNSGALLLGCLLIPRSLLRAGHFDVDLYPSQAILYRSITVLLAGIYLLIVGVFAEVVTFLGGDAAFTLKAFLVLVSLVVLAMLLLSDRVKLQTRRFVSRHFQRPLHDYRTVWRTFTEGTASSVEQAEFCRTAVRLIADIFQVLSASIWLVDDKKEKLAFAASTSLSEMKAAHLEPHGTDAVEIIRHLRQHPDPVDVESSRETWVAALRRCHPDEFTQGGSRVCVPLISSGEVLGLILVCDRVGGSAFSLQDFDLLKCVGGQVASSLHNAQLSQKLVEAKELEAFQTMSAFFVHDLKNTASTLNLMLQNLPVHFDDPAFRADALRGISKTVIHINHLIDRLSHLRHDLKIQPSESDLNEVVSRALEGWEKASQVVLVKELRPLPRIFLDQEQVLKVVTNLVINATEAVDGKGLVRIETSQRDGWTVLSVADNGCGMTPEFLNRSLFRPFQTTKKTGLGIGMFQSKMIVEAHQGRLEVESELGKGTTFRVFLPLQTEKR
ncbi:MAG: PEP-CTERM system histidine kinase PrsK [Pedosphaera sp.]|nr:PEP-CTERM system histidine kinase PrsK [Pedosphaera sp.]